MSASKRVKDGETPGRVVLCNQVRPARAAPQA
jgi:hypothetical protein